MSEENQDRRPIKARSAGWASVIAEFLAKKNVSPNSISASSLVFGLVGLMAFYSFSGSQSRGWLVVGALCVLLRLLANMFDGMVAVHTDKVSPIGDLYNEIPDRLADCFLILGFGIAVDGHLALALFASLAAVMTAYVRAAIKVAGGKNQFCGPLAKPHRMFTIIALSLLGALFPSLVSSLVPLGLHIIFWGSLVTCVRRIRLGVAGLS